MEQWVYFLITSLLSAVVGLGVYIWHRAITGLNDKIEQLNATTNDHQDRIIILETEHAMKKRRCKP